MEKDIKKEEVKEEKNEKEGKKGLILALILICILLLAGIGVCLFIIFKPGNKPKPVIDGTSITITFDSDGGLEVDKITFKKGTEVELPTSTKDGFEFGGWFNGETEFTKEDTPKLEKDITLKAKWNELTSEESLMTINFDSKGGNKISSIQVKCINNSTEITNLPTPKREGYNFMSWADKNGTPILNGANLICDEELNLYANWEKKEDNKKTAKCPNGYAMNQDGTKCVQPASASLTCDSGWKLINGECYNPSVDTNIREGNRTCPEKTINGWTGTGYLYNQGRDYCAYYEMPSYTGANQQCANAGGHIIPGNSYKCFKYVGYDYSMTCSSGTKYVEAQAFGGGSNPGCYYYKAANKVCPDGYSNNTGYGDCAKLVDPTYE